MNCPKCNCELDSANINGVMLETCDSCEGIWFDPEELIKIIQIPEEELRVSNIASSLEESHEDDFHESGFRTTCPKCGETMEVQTYSYDSGIKMDKCNSCGGVWLDDGEIKSVIDYCAKNKTPLPAEKVEELNKKFKEIEAYWKQMEDNLADNIVRSDEIPEIVGVPEKLLQAIYTFFMMMGL